MTRKNRNRITVLELLSLPLAAWLVVGCSSGTNGSTTSTSTSTATGEAFVIGTDAPMAAITSFQVQVENVYAVDSNNNQVPLVSGTPTVDFARYNGLQTLLDLNSVPVGTYNSIVVQLGTATLSYLNTQQGAAPTITTEPATLTSSSVTVNLTSPLVVSQTEPVGLRVDFNLAKSIQVTNGAITGTVTPTFNISTVATTDPGGYMDEFDAGIVSVNQTGQSFVIQGPHGHQFTVNVTGQTEWDNNESLASLSTSSIVQISGTIDKATSTIDADEVAILSQDGFYASGQITYVTPSSGAASSFDLFVRGVLPTTTGLTLGQLAQVNLSGNENYFIYWMHNPLTEFLFNDAGLLPGQEIAVGGPASGAANAQDVTVKRIVLRHWGFNGTLVAGSVSESNNTFQMNVTGFAGQLIPGPVTVYVASETKYRNGPNSLSDVSSLTNVRVVGLLIKNPIGGQPVILAHYVDELN
jgi:hypothetical protein